MQDIEIQLTDHYGCAVSFTPDRIVRITEYAARGKIHTGVAIRGFQPNREYYFDITQSAAEIMLQAAAVSAKTCSKAPVFSLSDSFHEVVLRDGERLPGVLLVYL